MIIRYTLLLWGAGVLLSLAGCGKDQASSLGDIESKAARAAAECSQPLADASSGSTGKGFAFLPDPSVAAAQSGVGVLSANSSRLNEFKTPINLDHLGGRGILQGQFVDVRNGLYCSEGYKAFSEKNEFQFQYGDPKFQEAMTYALGDLYRSELHELGLPGPKEPVRMVAHCMLQDNAYFTRVRDSNDKVIEKVCLGDSVTSPGASYTDDAVVTIHELQHSLSAHGYDQSIDLNQYWYDEAGALNEAVSDFMGLAFTSRWVSQVLDPRIFSRWALGQFDNEYRSTRGAHLCPEYDTDFPNCKNFSNGYVGFSADQGTVSYTYPDGLGWPYAKNYPNRGALTYAFQTFRGQEENHYSGILMVGALWDIFEVIKGRNQGDYKRSYETISKWIARTLSWLPKPSLGESPVNFRRFAAVLLDQGIEMGIDSEILSGSKNALERRGLIAGESVGNNWLSRGAGSEKAPGVKILDNASKLKSWLSQLGQKTEIVTQGPTPNEQLSPGETALIWFDLQNDSLVSAGGIQLKVTIETPGVEWLPSPLNLGAVNEKTAYIQYGKVNGTGIVSRLFSENSLLSVPTENRYFKTNPFFDQFWTTGLWLKASASIEGGDKVEFKVEASPSNGEMSETHFQLQVN